MVDEEMIRQTGRQLLLSPGRALSAQPGQFIAGRSTQITKLIEQHPSAPRDAAGDDDESRFNAAIAPPCRRITAEVKHRHAIGVVDLIPSKEDCTCRFPRAAALLRRPRHPSQIYFRNTTLTEKERQLRGVLLHVAHVVDL